MKVLILAFILTYISAIGAFQIKKIEGVKGLCNDVFFDSKFNSFLYCVDYDTDFIERFYKLDPDNNIVFVKEFVDSGCGMMLNHKDELYLICQVYNQDDHTYNWDLSIIRVNSSEIEKIASFNDLSSFFGDNAGNLLFNDPGLFFLRYNTTEPVSVKNLEDFIASSYIVATDKNEDTYVGGQQFNGGIQENKFIVIPADSKEGTPEGYAIEGLIDDPVRDAVREVSVIFNNELLIRISDGHETASVKKISNGTVTAIYANEGQFNYKIYPGDKRTIIMAFDVQQQQPASQARITSLTPDGEIVEISNSRNQSWPADEKGVAFDEEGNAFIGWNVEGEERTYLEFLNYSDTTTVAVDLGDIKYTHFMDFDGNNNLWLASYYSGVYFIERGSLELQKVPDSSNDFRGMWVNPKRETSEVFLNTEYEFFVISH